MAQIVGKSRPHVANMVRLLKLSEPVKALVQSGTAFGRPRAACWSASRTRSSSRRTSSSAGSTCARSRSAARKDGRAQARDDAPAPSRAKDADTKALERRLSDALGLEVTVDHRGQGGTLHIKYAIWISWTRC